MSRMTKRYLGIGERGKERLLGRYGRACDSPGDRTVAEMAMLGFGYKTCRQIRTSKVLFISKALLKL